MEVIAEEGYSEGGMFFILKWKSISLIHLLINFWSFLGLITRVWIWEIVFFKQSPHFITYWMDENHQIFSIFYVFRYCCWRLFAIDDQSLQSIEYKFLSGRKVRRFIWKKFFNCKTRLLRKDLVEWKFWLLDDHRSIFCQT